MKFWVDGDNPGHYFKKTRYQIQIYPPIDIWHEIHDEKVVNIFEELREQSRDDDCLILKHHRGDFFLALCSLDAKFGMSAQNTKNSILNGTWQNIGLVFYVTSFF